MDLTDLNAAAEKLWLSAEFSQRIYPAYFVVVSDSEAYITEYKNNFGFDYCDWFLIPSEVIFNPTSNIKFKRTTFVKPIKTKIKPLLLKNHSTIPLRI